MTENDIDYFTRRAQQHRDRATATKDSAARRLHDQFAAQYTARATRAAEPELA